MLKQISSIFIAILGLLFLTVTVFAQNPPAGGEQEIAKKYGVTFPIAQLGNCASVSACKTFCDNPDNHQSCTDFAQKHNLATKSTSSTAKSDEEILKLAKVEFGCSSYDACMAFCEQDENMDRCTDFASRHNLGGNAAQMKQQMATVKNLLGCSSMKACMDFCNNPTNMQKCMEVFKQAGFPVEASYSGPGGCNSEESCTAYCEKNPKECGGENYQSEPPEVWCPKVSAECNWDGQSCNCGGSLSRPQESGEIWCTKAGAGCKWTGTTCECPGQNYTEGPPLGTDPTEWCNQNPGKCTYQNSGDYSAECAKNGCGWDGKTCQCAQSDQNVDFSSQCLSQPGCSWDATSKTCSCSTQQTSTPADNPSVIQGGETIYKSECLAASCKWSDDPKACDCSGVGKDVQGVSTNRSLLQQILDFILGR